MKLPPLMLGPITRLLAGVLLAGLIWEGCAMMPETPVNLTVKDADRQFPAGTILATQTRRAVTYEEMLTDLEQVQVVFVGEKHDNPAHHAIQVRLIESLHAMHPKLTVGMEMFDHRYDPVLAQWSAGALDREVFIQKTHWYVYRAGWGFPFDLYAPIFETVRDNNIRLVGLDMPGWIPPKISHSGLDNLLPDERSLVAADVYTGNDEYRAYLKEIHIANPHHQVAFFDYFFEAQCARDDTMAASIVRKMGDAPMVVIVGNGHIIRKFGVPERLHARSQASFRTVYLATIGEEVEWNYADYIWVTPQKPAAATQNHR